MCGIAGIMNSGGLGASTRSCVERMVDALRHRGPDGSGVIQIGSDAVLGHTRLAIVDLASGAQPMCSRDGRFAVTFNGEIYGYRRLRAATDYPYATESDTEVLLAMYAAAGRDMVRRLPGMSVSPFGTTEKSLLRARPVREKPFYYAVTPGGFRFASELKGILASGLLQPVLMWSRWGISAEVLCPSAPDDHSNVSVLPPGHCLTCRDGRVSVEKYWTFPEAGGPDDLAEAGEELGRHLRSMLQNNWWRMSRSRVSQLGAGFHHHHGDGGAEP